MIAWKDTRQRLQADRTRLEAYFVQSGRRPFIAWLEPSYQCVWLHRWSFYCHSHGHRLGARFLWHLNLLLTGCDIAPLSDIGGGLVVPFPLSVGLIGTIGANCTLEGHVGVGGGTRRSADVGAGPGLPVIGDDVTLGWGALVMGPVRVGHRVTIGHGAIVTVDVPDDATIPDKALVILRRGMSA